MLGPFPLKLTAGSEASFKETLVKITILALVPLFTAALASYAAGPAATPPPQSGVQVCAADIDAENLCKWDAPKGTPGRKCVLDVEHMSRKDVCAYGNATAPTMTDHKPMCISASKAEHIVFQSGNGRQFRVRRLVPMANNGGACPAHPFNHQFNEGDLTFGGNIDTTAPKAAASGCFYKLEIQFETIDSNAPKEPHDSKGRRFECRDPHLGVTP